MGNTTVIIRSFDNPVFKVTEFEDLIIRVKPFDDMVIVVPGTGEEEEENLAFDYSLDFDI